MAAISHTGSTLNDELANELANRLANGMVNKLGNESANEPTTVKLLPKNHARIKLTSAAANRLLEAASNSTVESEP